jgi:tight adherence protein C
MGVDGPHHEVRHVSPTGLSLVVGLTVAAVMVGGSLDGRAPRRLAALRPPTDAGPVRPVDRRADGATPALLAALGGAVIRVAHRLGSRPGAVAAALGPRRIGGAVLTVAVVVPFAPVLAPLAAGAVVVPPVLARRRAERVAAAAVLDGLPEVVDLLAVAVGAGWTPGRAVAAVAPRAPAPWDDALGAALGRAALGTRLADALDVVVAALGEAARPLVAALRSAELDGAPLGPGLERLAADARVRRRRAAEEAARRVPVRLLFPLVLLALPAFALLAMAPLVAGALRDLPL